MVSFSYFQKILLALTKTVPLESNARIWGGNAVSPEFLREIYFEIYKKPAFNWVFFFSKLSLPDGKQQNLQRISTMSNNKCNKQYCNDDCRTSHCKKDGQSLD